LNNSEKLASNYYDDDHEFWIRITMEHTKRTFRKYKSHHQTIVNPRNANKKKILNQIKLINIKMTPSLVRNVFFKFLSKKKKKLMKKKTSFQKKFETKAKLSTFFSFFFEFKEVLFFCSTTSKNLKLEEIFFCQF